MTAVEMILTGPAEWMTQYVNQLVSDRLIACAQLGPIVSTYRWEGEVEIANETRAALHTIQDNVATLMERTQTAHPYDVPCILVMPIQSANPAYLDWIIASCQAEVATK